MKLSDISQVAEEYHKLSLLDVRCNISYLIRFIFHYISNSHCSGICPRHELRHAMLILRVERELSETFGKHFLYCIETK